MFCSHIPLGCSVPCGRATRPDVRPLLPRGIARHIGVRLVCTCVLDVCSPLLFPPCCCGQVVVSAITFLIVYLAFSRRFGCSFLHFLQIFFPKLWQLVVPVYVVQTLYDIHDALNHVGVYVRLSILALLEVERGPMFLVLPVDSHQIVPH